MGDVQYRDFARQWHRIKFEIEDAPPCIYQCVHVRMRVFSLSHKIPQSTSWRRYERRVREPVTRSFTNDDDERRYDEDDDDGDEDDDDKDDKDDEDDEDDDDEHDHDEEDDGVRDDTHRKTRISGVGA